MQKLEAFSLEKINFLTEICQYIFNSFSLKIFQQVDMRKKIFKKFSIYFYTFYVFLMYAKLNAFS